jgi:hypothetical protein
MEDELREALEAALEYIDAIPSEVASMFPAMPGFNRDWADALCMAGRIAKKV